MIQSYLMNNLFPVAMIVLSIGAALSYATGGDYAKAVYWVAASVLTTTTLFM